MMKTDSVPLFVGGDKAERKKKTKQNFSTKTIVI